MIEITTAVLLLAGLLYGYRLAVGPSLSDRVIAVNGMILVGTAAIATHATHSGNGLFLPVLVVLALVGFVSTAILARFIESRGR